MSASPSDLLESDAYNEKPSEQSFECSICGDHYEELGCDKHITDCENVVCEFCLKKVVSYTINTTTNKTNPYYGTAEHNNESLETGWYAHKCEARMRILTMVATLYPDVPKVEV